jgi:hypothetical protein
MDCFATSLYTELICQYTTKNSKCNTHPRPNNKILNKGKCYLILWYIKSKFNLWDWRLFTMTSTPFCELIHGQLLYLDVLKNPKSNSLIKSRNPFIHVLHLNAKLKCTCIYTDRKPHIELYEIYWWFSSVICWKKDSSLDYVASINEYINFFLKIDNDFFCIH